ncbi:MAG: hypothetical protein GX641_01105 [Mollicutes bacterium]|nr:hypothetical protein [Mollicutes bacterium]
MTTILFSLSLSSESLISLSTSLIITLLLSSISYSTKILFKSLSLAILSENNLLSIEVTD